MAEKSDDLKELDAAFAGLSDSAAGRSAPSIVAGDSGVPPPMPARTGRPPEPHPKLERTRRVAFDDLFATDSSSPQPAGGGPEAKIEYLRDKLKRAEAQLGQFRQAWTVREREMDGLETWADEAGERALAVQIQLDQANQKLKETEAFFKTKKHELEVYSQKVAQSFSELQQTEAGLRRELVELGGEAQRQRERVTELCEAVGERDRTIAQLQAAVGNERDQAATAKRQQQTVAELRGETTAQKRRIEELEVELETAREEAFELRGGRDQESTQHAAERNRLTAEVAALSHRLRQREDAAGSAKQELALRAVEMEAHEEELLRAQRESETTREALREQAHRIEELEITLVEAQRGVGAATGVSAPDPAVLAEACDAAVEGATALEQVNQSLRQAGVTTTEQRKLMRAGVNKLLTAITRIRRAVGLPE
jgi:chromosome segregation ATPase